MNTAIVARQPSTQKKVLNVFQRLAPRGLFARRVRQSQPALLLELYSMEGCPACRRVRVALTELDLDYIHRSCPKGDERNRDFVEARGGKRRFPYLVDPNMGIEMYESHQIIAYLNERYT